jgi:hypothetical protein
MYREYLRALADFRQAWKWRSHEPRGRTNARAAVACLREITEKIDKQLIYATQSITQGTEA